MRAVVTLLLFFSFFLPLPTSAHSYFSSLNVSLHCLTIFNPDEQGTQRHFTFSILDIRVHWKSTWISSRGPLCCKSLSKDRRLVCSLEAEVGKGLPVSSIGQHLFVHQVHLEQSWKFLTVPPKIFCWTNLLKGFGCKNVFPFEKYILVPEMFVWFV